jgi:hypothetical protein
VADSHSRRDLNDGAKGLPDLQQHLAIDVIKPGAEVRERSQKDGQGRANSAAELPSTADISLSADDPPDLEALLEERRRKRRELLERLAGTQSGVNSATPSSLDGSTGAQSTGTTGE